MTQHFLVLFFCLSVVMIGLRITRPVFAFHAERLAVKSRASEEQAAVQVELLTGIYALMQFLFAPFWARWSDRVELAPGDLQLRIGSDRLTIPAFSVPFLAAALLALLTLPVIVRWLPESLPSSSASRPDANLTAPTSKGQTQQTQAALGMRNAANSLGQAGGAAIEGLLFALDMRAAYSIAGLVLVASGILSGSVMQSGKMGGSDKRSGEAAL